jgi:hypothetical protein
MVLGWKRCTLPGLDLSLICARFPKLRDKSQSQPPFSYSSTALQRNKTSCPLSWSKGIRAYLWLSQFDEIANRKSTSAQTISLSHNKFPLLARFEERFTQHLSCALCWVRSASQPSFSLPSRGLVPFLPQTRLLISCFSTCNVSQSLPARSYQFYATICGRDIAYRSVPAEGDSILETAASLFPPLLNLARSQMLGAQEQRKRSSTEAASEEAIGFDNRL